MPLSHEHQLSLLTDILSNHKTDCCGSVSECEQVKRLAAALLGNQHIDSHVKTILTDIYTYSQNGINTNNLEEHITSHQDSLTQWVDDIHQFS
ncbi:MULTISPECIES: YtzH-like family protein [Peribacillus]|uniref:YtzH-like family protein n=1 Tax=Peribacillus TaxID=2675229 RepID=UPI000FDB089B|nr:YtzH-like family protein [Peribacillus asahii]USK59126.1 YtzH-like family protein [Peribacillus asahii]USK69545.1 YtzH-like family protein [Peribacillus asahii]USK84417.1 YtzH-like family protein [Peribacillus asahii]